MSVNSFSGTNSFLNTGATPVQNSFKLAPGQQRVSASQIQDTGLRSLLAPTFKPINSYAKLGVASVGDLEKEMAKYQAVDPAQTGFQDLYSPFLQKHASAKSSLADRYFLTPDQLKAAESEIGQNYAFVGDEDWGKLSPYKDFSMISALGQYGGQRAFRRGDFDKALAGGFEKEAAGTIDPLVRQMMAANIIDRDGKTYYTGHLNPTELALQGGRSWQDELRDRWLAAHPIGGAESTPVAYNWGGSEFFVPSGGTPGTWTYRGQTYYREPWQEEVKNGLSDTASYNYHRGYSQAEIEAIRDAELQQALASPAGQDILAQILETGSFQGQFAPQNQTDVQRLLERFTGQPSDKLIGGDERRNNLTAEQMRLVLGTKGNLVNKNTGQVYGTVLNAPSNPYHDTGNIQETTSSKNLLRRRTDHNYNIWDVGHYLDLGDQDWWSKNASRIGDNNLFIASDKLGSMPGGGSVDWHEHTKGTNTSRSYTGLGKVANFALNFVPVVGPTLAAMQNMYMAGGLKSPLQGLGMVAGFVAPGLSQGLNKAFDLGSTALNKAASSAVMGAIQGGLSSGSWKGALAGGLSGGLGSYGSSLIGNANLGSLGTTAANIGLRTGLGGLSSAMMGNDFRQGALNSLIGSTAGTLGASGANYLANQVGLEKYAPVISSLGSQAGGRLASQLLSDRRRRSNLA